MGRPAHTAERKSKIVDVRLMMTPQVVRALNEAAGLEDRSRSDLIRHAIKKYLAERGILPANAALL
jgi:metal-responsive CopG/Arc/MetJ family transcriptional regulator